MDAERLATLLQEPEGEKLEFKTGDVRSDVVARILGAFANTSGGTLVWGFDERQRAAVGVSDPDLGEQRMRRGLSLVSPQPDAAVERVDLDGKVMLVAQVSRTPGHLYLADRQLLERAGARVQAMSGERLAELTTSSASGSEALAENNKVLTDAIGALRDDMADLKEQNSFGRRLAIGLGGAAFGALLRPIIELLT